MKLDRSLLLLPALLGAGGCLVPEARYKQSVAALHAEMDAHRRTLARLYEIETKLVELERSLAEREQLLARGEQRLAQAELDVEVMSKRREAADDVVDQLRNDLARVADHLQTFALQKAELDEALDAAEARAERLAAAEREAANAAPVMRDLTLAFHESMTAGEIEVVLQEGRPVIAVPRARLIAPEGTALHAEAFKTLDGIVKVASRHPESRLRITDRGAAGESQNQAAIRLKRVADGLVGRGMPPERVAIEVPPSGPGESAVAPAGSAAPAPGAAGAASSAAPAGPTAAKIEFAFAFED